MLPYSNMYNNDDLELDNIFKAMSHVKRRKILILLRNTPMTTGYLCQLFPEIDRCTVMKHLKVLEKANLITIKRIGKERWNYINTDNLNKRALPWIKQLED